MTLTTPHPTWHPDDRASVVDAAAHALAEQYVFPDVGAALADALRIWWATTPERPDTPEAFCAAVSAALRAHTPDGHLRLRVKPEKHPHHGREPFASAHGLTRAEILDGNVGLLELRGFFDVTAAAPIIAAALQLMAGTRALILDLRRNGGGDPACTAFLQGFFFAEPLHVNTFWHRGATEGVQTWTPSVLPAPRYLDRPVFVLTSRRTASGAEEVAYVLRHAGRATLIGETTAGAAHPGEFVSVHPHLELFVPGGRPVVPLTGGNWEGVGVEPHIAVPAAEALEVALGQL
ncbi:S41 family peptidase [Deinococcus maricopensis]|uniref:Peptidase S41 n=1 Tax=Deinococcus maricopensis (strain DSM 21211 / LMG 22137 / NRRL B-23946 / LB-34) TaxID=709986 RepID=E8U5M0_DEIML|nr:S41 family peptidase [Deinococcus maricopensis]ADV66359.1 peptidase S41 [Deinococcus maricopensis DSM 21211]